ncbi:MAG: hypothetical protein P8177_12330, partial [Gemmatimonadota bacterium]
CWAVTVMAGVAVLVGSPAGVGAQSPGEAVLVAAGEWALGRLPGGSIRLDPHRTGEGVGREGARRVAEALGAELATLEETRHCGDPLEPSSCRLSVDVLLAISAPRIDGDAAQVRVYAWYRSDDPRRPVSRQSWDLGLRRSGGEWRVTSGG